MTNLVASLLNVPAAYKALVLPLMLAEANVTSEMLNLPTEGTIQTQHLTSVFVGRTNYGVAGHVQTRNFDFTFMYGSLHTVARLDVFRGPELRAEIYRRLQEQTNQLNERSAYKLATQWLAILDVDVDELERRHQPSITQWKFLKPFLALPTLGTASVSNQLRETLLPVYEIRWGTNGLKPGMSAPVEVRVLGTTKELLYLGLKPPTVSRRPPIPMPPQTKEIMAPYESNLIAQMVQPATNNQLPWQIRWAPPKDLKPELRANWMRDFLGANTIQVLCEPDRVEVSVIKRKANFSEYSTLLEAHAVTSGPKVMPVAEAREWGERFCQFNSYRWYSVPFSHNYVARLQFTRGDQAVTVQVDLFERYLRILGEKGPSPPLCFGDNSRKLLSWLLAYFPEEPSFRTPTDDTFPPVR